MFVDDSSPGNLPASCHVDGSWCVQDLIVACALESRRQAEHWGELDNLVGGVLVASAPSVDPKTLQKIDLWRQEANGLCCLLQLSVKASKSGENTHVSEVAGCFPVASQRARVLNSRNGK